MECVDKKTFKILSIDGGGIKGLYSAKILEHFEDHFKCHISDHFDLLCGTSTGGLIALGLSLKIPASELVSFYVNKGPLIFPDRTKNKVIKLYDTFRQTFWKGKFCDKELKKALLAVFGELTLAESHNLLCIPSYTITEGRPWIFKFDHSNLSRDNNTKYVDVALATSAAPTYFPVAQIANYNNKQFIDGGVWANNPTMVGLIEALTYFVGETKEYKSIEILSLSSLTIIGGEKTGIGRKRPFIKWKNKLFETSLTGQSLFTDYFMNKIHEISGTQIKYVRIPSAEVSSQQESIVQLDVATKAALDLIKGKGDDQGLLYRKKPEIANFFINKKTYQIK